MRRFAGFLYLILAGTVWAQGTSATVDRVSPGVRAISQNPANRLAPVAMPDESFTSFTLEPGVRVTVQKPRLSWDKSHSPLLVFYLLPNGNTTEQAEGKTTSPELDWHYDIQHIAAQTRRVQALLPHNPVATAVMEADTLSWPAWRKAVPDSNHRIRQMVDEVRDRSGMSSASVCLVAHSGGGSFITGFINAYDVLPEWVSGIAYLDANYSYDTEEGHGDKLAQWLKADPKHQLTVLAYDDRRIKIGGKPIVSDTGGTWRATDRMFDRLSKDFPMTGGKLNALETSATASGSILLARHPNPDDKILHTVLVEKNGFVYSVVRGRLTPRERDLPYAEKEAYRELIR